MNAASYQRAEASQRAAADPAVSVFVTANAGSGKTKVLIDRIARLLLRGDADPASFLCITYTKAAAAEMQRRLFARLGAWCVMSDDKLHEELTTLTQDSGLAVTPDDLARARALFARALETPGGLRIQTIHAFCERLLGRFPLEAGVAPGFDIVDDVTGAALIEAAWARVVADPSSPPGRALHRFASVLAPPSLDERLKALIGARGDLDRLIRAGGGLEACVAAAFAARGAHRTCDQVITECLRGLDWKGLRAAVEVLKGSGKQDSDRGAKLLDAVNAYGEPSPDPEQVLAKLSGALLTGEFAIPQRLATKGLAAAHPFLVPLLEDSAQAVLDARAAVCARERAEDAEAALRLSEALSQAYAFAKAQRGALDFDDLVDRALSLLCDAEAAPWVLYKLDGGVDHILIDEGQDTSPRQWELLAPLQAEFFAGEGARSQPRTVFAVGDPKQSIYSFQGAEPARFQSEAQTLAARAGAAFRAPELTMSFRSTPQVLQAVDAVFNGLAMAGDPPELFNEVAHSARRAEALGCVEWWPISPKPDPEESDPYEPARGAQAGVNAAANLADAIAKEIADSIARGALVYDDKGVPRPMHAGDVLILVRKRRAMFTEILRACKARGLPVAGADKMVLANELAIEDAVVAARVALDPSDDYSLACVLKGPWVGWDEPDEGQLFALAHGRADGETLWSRLQADASDRAQAAAAFVHALHERRGLSPFDFFTWLLETPDTQGRSGWWRVLERVGTEALDPLQELVSRALAAPGDGLDTLERFLHRLLQDGAEVKREQEGAGAAIRIMTVHGAKGLEAPVVFLPETTGPSDVRLASGVLLAPGQPLAISPSAGADDPTAAQVRAALTERGLGEHWRLFYVAMTRARDRLVICGAHFDKGRAANSWHVRAEAALREIAEPHETPFGEGLRIGSVQFAAEAGAASAAAKIEPPAWATRPAPAPKGGEITPSARRFGAALSPLTGASAVARGRLIHGLLHRLAELPAQDRAAAGVKWLARQAVQGGPADALVAEALAVIDAPAAAAAFASGSRGEVPLVGMVAGRAVRGVVDRLALSETEALVVDFKSDRPAPDTLEETPDGYFLQMALYQAVLRQALPGRAVRCVLVWTHGPHVLALPDAKLHEALASSGLVEA